MKSWELLFSLGGEQIFIFGSKQKLQIWSVHEQLRNVIECWLSGEQQMFTDKGRHSFESSTASNLLYFLGGSKHL